MSSSLFEGYLVTSPYGNRPDPFGSGKTEFHKGIDLVKSHKAPIYAFVSGKIIHAKMGVSNSGFGDYGIVVAVLDKYGALHVYAHLDSASVAVGDTVVKGQEVGRQGTTGMSTGSHLHYEVRKESTTRFGYGSHVNPTNYLISYQQKEEEIEMEELKKQLAEAIARITELEKNQSMAAPPEWAKEAVAAAVAAGVLAEPNGGSWDFYRMITIMHRITIFK